MPRSDDDYGWYKRFPKKFIRGVRGMGPDLIGAYSVILDLIYEDEDSCPNDHAWLGGIMGCNGRKARALIDGLVKRGKLSVNEHGRLVNEKATQVLNARQTIRQHARDNGATGGQRSADAKAAANKNKDLADQSLGHVDKNREENKRKEVLATPKAPPPARKPRQSVPDEFPSAEAKAAAVIFWNGKGRPDLAATVADQAAQFRDHHTAHGKKMADWPAAWRTWIRNALEMTRPPRHTLTPVPNNSAAMEPDTATWVRRLEYYDRGSVQDEVERGYWSVQWGPKPHQEGCKVPQAALDAYAAKWPPKAASGGT